LLAAKIVTFKKLRSQNTFKLLFIQLLLFKISSILVFGGFWQWKIADLLCWVK